MKSANAEKVMQDRRSDVVRQISVNAHAPAAGDLGDIRSRTSPGTTVEIRELLRQALQPPASDASSSMAWTGARWRSQMLGHLPVARRRFRSSNTVCPLRRGAEAPAIAPKREWRARSVRASPDQRGSVGRDVGEPSAEQCNKTRATTRIARHETQKRPLR